MEDKSSPSCENEDDSYMPNLTDIKSAFLQNWEAQYLKALESMDGEEIQRIIYGKTEVEASRFSVLKKILFLLWKNNFDAVNHYLLFKLDVQTIEEQQRTNLLFLLISHRCPLDTILLLIESGIDPNLTFPHGLSPLIYAAAIGRLDLLQAFHRFLPDHEKLNKSFQTNSYGSAGAALLHAAKSQSLECVSFLLDNGFPVTIKDENGRTSLMCAACSGTKECIALLLEHGADVHCKTNRGVSALMLAAQVGSISSIQFLIANDADVTEADNSYKTVLMYAIDSDSHQCVEVVLKSGAAINLVDVHGNSALIYASQSIYVECLKVLLNFSADVTIKNKAGYTAYTQAASCGNYEALDLLLDTYSDLENRDRDGRTLLHIAASNGHLDCLKLVLRHGADITCVDNNGKTALDLARLHGHHRCEKVITSHTNYPPIVPGMSMNPEDGSPSSLMFMCKSEKSHGIQTLISNGADVNYIDNDGNTAVIYSVVSNAVDCLAILIKNGAALNIINQDNISALIISAAKNYAQCLSLLLRHGASASLTANCRVNGAILAASKGSLETLRLLLHYRPDLAIPQGSDASLLVSAVHGSNFRCVKYLLKKGFPITHMDEFGNSVLAVAAAGTSHMEMMNVILERGASVDDASDDDNKTGLMNAAFKGNLIGVQFLLMHGASVNLQNRDGLNALMFSILGKSFPCTYVLLRAKSNINVRDTTGNTAIKYAAQIGLVDTVRMLLAHPDGVVLVNDDGSSAALNALAGDSGECLSLVLNKMLDNGDAFDPSLFFYAARQGCISCLKVLLDFPQYNINDVDDCGTTLLMHAASGGSLECVKLLCESGVDLEQKDNIGKTAALYGCHTGKYQCVEFLVEKGASLDVTDDKGTSALMFAAGSKQELCVEFVLRHFSDVNSIDQSGFNALIYAIVGKNVECLKALLRGGVDRDHRDTQGMTAFLYSAHCGAPRFMEFLFESGCPIEQINNLNQTALLLASITGSANCIRFLMSKNANALHKDRFGKTALIYTAENGNVEALECLLDSGCNINQMDTLGYTPLLRAIQESHLQIVQRLLERGADANLDRNLKSPLMSACCLSKDQDGQRCVELLLLHGAYVDFSDIHGKTALNYAVIHENTLCMQLLLNERVDVSKVEDNGASALSYAACHVDTTCLEMIMNTDFYQHVPRECTDPFFMRSLLDAKQRCLRFILSRGHFKWEWMGQVFTSLENIARVLVTMNIHPGEFEMYDEKYTLLQYALVRCDFNTIKYLLANLYLAKRDLNISGNASLMRAMKSWARHDQRFKPLLPRLVSTPFNLQALCMFTISNCLSSRSASPFGRKILVDSLPLPNILKEFLNFEKPISRLCPKEWEHIDLCDVDGELSGKDLLAMKKSVWLLPPIDLSCCPDCAIDP